MNRSGGRLVMWENIYPIRYFYCGSITRSVASLDTNPVFQCLGEITTNQVNARFSNLQSEANFEDNELSVQIYHLLLYKYIQLSLHDSACITRWRWLWTVIIAGNNTSRLGQSTISQSKFVVIIIIVITTIQKQSPEGFCKESCS